MRILNKTSHSALVFYQGNHYAVSDNGYETLIFPASPSGSITQLCEVGGGRELSLDDVLSNWNTWFFGNF